MIVDFAVEDDPNALILVPHWLMTALKVDDRQSAMTKKNG